MPLPERAYVEQLVRSFCSAPLKPTGLDLRGEIVDWICATGDCVLHAVYEVRKLHGFERNVCMCANCAPHVKVPHMGGVVFTSTPRWR